MIEVEKKFILTEEQKGRLLKDAEFFSKIVFTDAYYDTDNFTLATKDVWLRARDGHWELKIPMPTSGERRTDQYEEVTEEASIRKYLDLPEGEDKNLEEVLLAHGYSPFCVCGTTRTKYRKEDFVIDLNSVEFGDFTYDLAEIELIVEGRPDIPEATRKIIEFAERQGLTIEPVRSKVIEYLRRKRPDIYELLLRTQAAKAAGV